MKRIGSVVALLFLVPTIFFLTLLAYPDLCMAQGSIAGDKAALEALYDTTNGDSWTTNTNWKSNKPLNQWYGISTNSQGQVSKIVLLSNQLTGTIPSEINGLTELTELQLSGNQLTGAIPTEIGGLTKLTWLLLNENQLTGAIPSQIGSLTELTRLLLSGNQLTGAIPSQIGSLTKLTRLLLSGNQLTGAIPSQIGSLTELYELLLNENRLTGAIPSQIGSLTELIWLRLDDNRLTGAIPSQIGSLTKLTMLLLDDNRLTGAIPSQIGSLTELTIFSLSSNQLTGAIPSEIGSLTKLPRLRLDNNQLTGAIPSEIGNLTGLTGLSLSSNQLTGAIPQSFLNLVNLISFFADGGGNRVCIPSGFLSWYNGISHRDNLPECSSEGTPGAPTSLTATANGQTQIDLSWDAPSSNGGADITGYRIEVSSNGGTGWSDRVTNTGNGNTTYSHTGLAPGSTRHYRLSAINSAEAGNASNVASATTDAQVSPPTGTTSEAPQNLRATAGDAQATLTWSAPDNDGGSAITGYAYRLKETGAAFGTWTDIPESGPGEANARSYTVTGLTNGLEYVFHVRAVNEHGGGLPEEVTVTLPSRVNTESEELPAEVALEGNYPNPFNPETTIRYALPQTSPVQFVVYDMLGHEVAVLIDGIQPQGRHTVRFHADGLPTGTYVYRLTAGAKTLTRTMTLLR